MKNLFTFLSMPFLAVLLVSVLFLTSCATRLTPAPIEYATHIPDYNDDNALVVNGSNGSNITKSTSNTNMQKLGGNHRTQINSLGVEKSTGAKILPAKVPSNAPKPLEHTSTQKLGWVIPTEGQVVSKFTLNTKGIDIKGALNQPIYAVEGGRVLYSGNGLKGYGNLIIIKHNATYLTAYAHNNKNLVQAETRVQKGQKIALMGPSNSKQAILHFEVRRGGKPIDPLTILDFK